MTSPDLCPLCGADLTGEAIPEDERVLSGPTHHHRAFGMSARIIGEPGGYFITYLCPDCKGTWPAEGQQP